jgi:4-nitrophenyl phosphatase
MVALKSLKGLILDADGVLWRGDRALPGAQTFLTTLDRKGIRYVLATNNPSQDPQGFSAKAAGLGLSIPPERIITSVTATIAYLTQHYPSGTAVHVIGEPALKRQVAEAGFRLANEGVVAVVVALDRSLSYETFKVGTRLILSGAKFNATNADGAYPTEEGFLPGSGMVVAALAASTGRTPVVMGKPERAIFDLALQRIGLPLQLVASVGDRLDTDIEGAARLGMKTILLLTGVTDPETLASSTVRPTWVFSDLVEFLRALED